MLPRSGPLTSAGKTRTLEIPLSAFSLDFKNISRLRFYFSELQCTRIIFPPSRTQSSLQQQFQGLLADYSFPAYAHTVMIHLPEDLTWRLLLTDDGYTSFSHECADSLSNKYTVRLYWLICAWRNRGGFVMRLSELRRILCLSRAYSRLDNLIARVLAPSEAEMESHFPIWFHYRFYEQDAGKSIVFKICLRVSDEQRSREMRAAWDYCFNLLTSVGAKPDTLQSIFSRLDYEDIRPFMEKLVEITTYIRSHHIAAPDRYILSVMDSWFSNWLERYQ